MAINQGGARAGLRAALKARLRAVRTHGALRTGQPGAAATTLCARLDEEALAFAAQNPDHSEAGRAAAFRELANRLGPEAAEARLHTFVNDLPTPGFLTSPDLARDDGVFFGLGRWVRIGAGALAALATVLVIGLFFYSLFFLPSWNDVRAAGLITPEEYQAHYDAVGDQKEALEAQLLEKPGVREMMAPTLAADEAGVNWILWAWLFFPVWALITRLRRKPARVLLLRKFNNKEIGKSLEKLSKRHLRPYGHIFTLADKHFKRNWVFAFLSAFWASPLTLMVRFITVPIGFVRRFWDRSRDGPILIWNANDFKHFAKRFEDRGGLNVEMARTQRKAVMIRTSDAWWQHVVELVMHAVDVIVIDLTQVAAGTVWELKKVPAEDVGERIVFTCREDKIADARQELITHGYEAWVDQIQVYTADGRFRHKTAFRAAMRTALQRRLGRQQALPA